MTIDKYKKKESIKQIDTEIKQKEVPIWKTLMQEKKYNRRPFDNSKCSTEILYIIITPHKATRTSSQAANVATVIKSLSGELEDHLIIEPKTLSFQS